MKYLPFYFNFVKFTLVFFELIIVTRHDRNVNITNDKYGSKQNNSVPHIKIL